MITAVLFVPAAPWLIPSVAPLLLAEQSALRRSVGALIDTTHVSRWSALGVSATGRSRWDRVLPMDLGTDPYRGGACVAGFPGCHFVARALLGVVPLDAGALAPSAPGDLPGDADSADRASVTDGLAELDRDDDGSALLVAADGSTAHGEPAPGGPDERAAGYDAALHAALTGGPAATRQWLGSTAGSPQLAADLGATLPTVLPAVLTALAGSTGGWDVSAHDLVMPYGVGHHILRWGRR
ncbi:hypothetical protein ABLG96_14515 [Nakamurella sp. A5-74]|uniref:Uncharacterized protein n=1 Tax=Nakamurella sp. A5-74 TaxID=3158264 RepID=A0AAU8DKG8_9ACTN